MKKIGIIGAMELEVEALKEQMDVKNIIEKASMKFYEGMLRGKDVVIVQCGIGKVNAGICVQILADLFQVDAVINTGVAGSLRAEINIGDIVVSTDACEHDMDVTALGYKQGIIPQMKESFFKADRQLVEAAIEVCREVNPDINVYEAEFSVEISLFQGKRSRISSLTFSMVPAQRWKAQPLHMQLS